MKVKAVNYREWLLNRIGRCRQGTVEFWFKVNERKREYESHWFARLFNFKFFKSQEWHWGYWYNEWNDYRFQKELDKVIYHIKLGDELVDMNEDFADAFYKYAKLNGLP